MSRLDDFCRLCGEFERAEFEVNDARYEGKHFGSWYIELEGKGIRSRQISLDGRDGLLIVQIQNAAVNGSMIGTHSSPKSNRLKRSWPD